MDDKWVGAGKKRGGGGWICLGVKIYWILENLVKAFVEDIIFGTVMCIDEMFCRNFYFIVL